MLYKERKNGLQNRFCAFLCIFLKKWCVEKNAKILLIMHKKVAVYYTRGELKKKAVKK